MKICPKCNSEHNKSGIYCCNQCSKSRGPWSIAHKQKLSQLALENPKGFAITKTGGLHKKGKGKIKETICPTCKISFVQPIYELQVYCSKNCRKLGGIRKGSGRSKHGYYNGFWIDSTYECAYLIYCLDHNYNITRNNEYFNYIDNNGKIRKYFPDFIVDGNLVEIKGYKTDNNQLKFNSVNKPIEILYKEDLKEVFKYVENKTSLKIANLYTLYD